jgi:hypothetical protein
MKKFLVGLFLLVSIGAKAQDSHKVSLKLYSQLQHSTGFSSNMNITNGQNALVTSTFRNTKLSMLPGVKLQSSAKISHELSLTGLDWERNESLTEVAVGGSVIPTAGNNSNEFIIGLRYEFGYSLPVFNQESNFNISLGAGASPTYYTVYNKPITSNSFPNGYSNLAIDLQIIPRVIYRLNDTWFLDLNIPITAIGLKYEVYTVENPAFSKDEQKQSDSSSDGLPSQYEIRFGVGYNL